MKKRSLETEIVVVPLIIGLVVGVISAILMYEMKVSPRYVIPGAIVVICASIAIDERLSKKRDKHESRRR